MNEQEINSWTVQNDRIKSNILSVVSAIDGMLGNHLSFIFTFNDEDKKKFHSIFFEPFVSFNTKITQYRKFLNLFIPEILDDKNMKNIFQFIEEFKKLRNVFAHAMEPLKIELENTTLTNMPYVRLYKWEESEMKQYDYSKQQIDDIFKKLDALKSLLALIDTLLISKSDQIKNSIVDERNNPKS